MLKDYLISLKLLFYVLLKTNNRVFLTKSKSRKNI